MLDYVGIVGFLIMLYTVYLIITDGSNKKESATDTVEESPKEEVTEVEAVEKPEPKPRKSAPAQTISSDGEDVLKQGKGYSEQESSETPNITPQSQQHFEEPPEQELAEPAPSTKNQTEQVGVDMVSVVCPYCDNKVLVPRGGSAECSCCSSILNDNGGIVD